MKKTLLFVAITIVSEAYGCATKDITKKVRVGKQVSIELPANKTTGYSWKYNCTPEDIVSIAEHYQAKSSLPGSPGVSTFTITGKKKGKARCTFTYKRPWEPCSKADDQKKYVIIVT